MDTVTYWTDHGARCKGCAFYFCLNSIPAEEEVQGQTGMCLIYLTKFKKK